ncbi:MAG: rRNA maturation RNase YbeY [Gammaproteobacteria bacterium]|nr:rRNA maturation RNase YbeY [Gammaproteobacteria bacterium]
MNITVDRQLALDDEDPHSTNLPSGQALEQWVMAALTATNYQADEAELTVRIVSNDESAELNEAYRNKQGPTNILSFPYEQIPGIPLPLLGDLIVAAEVVANEAAEQHKPLEAHWAHMIVHGSLHLLGYDHIDDEEATAMEALEISILAKLGYNNPYEVPETP